MTTTTITHMPRQRGKSMLMAMNTRAITQLHAALHARGESDRSFGSSLAAKANHSRILYAELVGIAASCPLSWTIYVDGVSIYKDVAAGEVLTDIISGHLWKRDGRLMYISSVPAFEKHIKAPVARISALQGRPPVDKAAALADVPSLPRPACKPWVRPEPLPVPSGMDVDEVPIEYLDDERFERSYEVWVEHAWECLFLQETFDDVTGAWNELLSDLNIVLSRKTDAATDHCGNMRLPEPYGPYDWHHEEAMNSASGWNTARAGDLRCMTGSRLTRYLDQNLGGIMYAMDLEWTLYTAMVPFRQFMQGWQHGSVGSPDNTTTLDTLLDEARRALEKAWNDEALHAQSKGRFYGDAQANGWIFGEGGVIS